VGRSCPLGGSLGILGTCRLLFSKWFIAFWGGNTMKLATAARIGLSGLLLAATAAHANVLTFDGNICAATPNTSGTFGACIDWSYLDQGYGDTATVDVSYIDVLNPTTDSLRFWAGNYNNLQNVAFANGSDANAHGRILLTAAPGYQINLLGFDVGAYPNTERNTNIAVSTSSSATILNFSGPVGTNDLAKTFSGFGAAGVGSQVSIDWYNSAYNVGIDNIHFDVVAVPEPETYAMMVVGLGMLGAVARRRRINRQ
jgi:hypothetical protein